MRRLTAVLWGATAACGAAVHPGSRPAVDAWLVWSSTEQGTTTEWLDAEGTVHGRADGLLVAYGDQLYRIDREPVEVPTMSCDEAIGEPGTDPAGSAVEPGTATRLVLAPLTGGTPMDVVAPEPPERGDDGRPFDAEHTHAASIQAGLGPFLFVAESTYAYSCGAHGNTVAEASVFDLSTGRPVTLLDADAIASARERARAALAASADGTDVSDPATEVHLAASVPTWTGGMLAMRHLFWIDACYACSDGEWSSYTRTVRIDDATLPLAFAAQSSVPGAVAMAVSARAEPRGVSWGTAGAAWAKALPPPTP